MISSRITSSIRFLSVLFLLATHVSVAATTKMPVILSTDVGNEIDDQWAIVYMLVNPDYDVLGIVSAHAPSLPDPSAHFTYKVLRSVVEDHLMMVAHPPLFEGASFPLKDGQSPQRNPGVDFIIEKSKAFTPENRLTILMIGAATDVASAILIDPTIVERIGVVAMAFKSWPGGGDEFNVANDVKAWQLILRSSVPVVVGDGDVCRANLALTLSQARDLVSEHGPVGNWLWSEFEAWYFRFVKPWRKDDFSKPWVIWDTIVLAYMEGMTTQQSFARPQLRDDMSFEQVNTSQQITWITAVDSQRMWADFLQKLESYQRSHAVKSYAGSL
jgi:purine nucleosidase